MRFHRAFTQSSGFCNFAQLPLFYVAQQEHRSLPLAQALDRPPNLRHLFPRQNLLLRIAFPVGQPFAGLVQIYGVGLGSSARIESGGYASSPSAN